MIYWVCSYLHKIKDLTIILWCKLIIIIKKINLTEKLPFYI